MEMYRRTNKTFYQLHLFLGYAPEGRQQFLLGQLARRQRAFFHLEIVNSDQLPFLGRNTMFWPYFLHLPATPV